MFRVLFSPSSGTYVIKEEDYEVVLVTDVNPKLASRLRTVDTLESVQWSDETQTNGETLCTYNYHCWSNPSLLLI